MTAQQEINTWLEQHRQLEDEAAKEQFYQSLLTTLGEKNSDNLLEGLLALKESVQTSRIKAEKTVPAKPTEVFQVFPNSQAEKELLQKLLESLHIPFKMSA